VRRHFILSESQCGINLKSRAIYKLAIIKSMTLGRVPYYNNKSTINIVS